MSNLLQLAIQAIEGKNQWYVGEKVTVATANGRQAYLRNDDCFIRLYTSDDRNDGLIVGWLDLGQGIWKIAQDAAANYASWAAKRRKEKKEMGKDDDKLMTLASKALAKYPALATRAQAAAELVRRGHIKPRIGGRFEVRSQSQADKYYIVDTEARTCTCYDYSHHAPEVCDGPMCKHRLAVLMLMKLQEAQAPDLARLHREERRIETRQAAMAAGVPVLLYQPYPFRLSRSPARWPAGLSGERYFPGNRKETIMTTYPVAFDEDQYPISLSQQQKAVIALARQQNGEIRTRDLVQQFGWNRFKAHNVLYRLRKRGVFHSQLIWSTTKNGNHVVSKDKDGQRRNLHSWLVCRLQPVEVWGQEPDVFCSNFHPTHPQRIRKEI